MAGNGVEHTRPKIGIGFTIIRMYTIPRTIGEVSIIEVRIASTTATHRKCVFLFTTVSGTTTTQTNVQETTMAYYNPMSKGHAIIVDTISFSMCSKSQLLNIKQAILVIACICSESNRSRSAAKFFS